MGMAARNGLTAAILAADGFGGPRGVFDHGHTVYKAFSRGPQPDLLTRALGEAWRGVTELAFKPYPCVAFMHPGLDAALAIRSKENIASTDISKVDLHFGRSGVHCIDNNPLKSHSAQYTLAVALTHGSLDIVNLFIDLRNSDPEVRRLSKCITVAADEGELEEAFPARYATVVEIETRDGRRLRQRQDIARGYPDAPMSARELHAKFLRIVTPAIGAHAAARAFEAARGLWDSMSVEPYAASLRARPTEVTTRP